MWTSKNNFYGSRSQVQLLSHANRKHQDQVQNRQVVTAASRPVSPMSAGFGESAEDLESHIQTQVWLQVWNLRINTNWLSQDYLYIYLDLCSNLAFLIIRCNKWKGRCTLLWCICVSGYSDRGFRFCHSISMWSGNWCGSAFRKWINKPGQRSQPASLKLFSQTLVQVNET